MTVTLSEGGSLLLYTVVYLVAVFFTHVRIKKKTNKTSLILLAIISLPPVILAANRYMTGTDFRTYFTVFSRIKTISLGEWLHDLDFINQSPTGLFVFSKIASAFPNDRQVYFGLLGFLSLFPVVVTLYREWNHDYFDKSLALFVFLFSTFSSGLNIIKQVGAIAIIIYALKFVYARDLKNYALFVFLAFLFHPSSIIAAPLYFIWNKRSEISISRRIIITVVSFATLYFANDLLNIFVGRYANYFNFSTSTGTSNLSFFIDLLWLLVFICFRNRFIKLDERNDLLIMMFAIGVIFETVGFWSVYGKRVGIFFTCIQFLLVAQIPNLFSNKNKMIVKGMLVLYFYAMFIISYFVLGHSGIIPYSYM